MTTATPLIVLDCDATSIEQEVIELLAAKAGSLEEVERITAAAMEGTYDFAESLKARVATLAGLPDSVFAEVASEITFSPGFAELVSSAHNAGGKVCVISGGFYEVLDLILPPQKVDDWHANRLEVIDGKLTGKVLGEIVTASTKAEYLARWAQLYQIPLTNTIAVGDGANDLEMLAAAAISVGFKAKPIVQESVDVHIDTTLSTVSELFAQFD